VISRDQFEAFIEERRIQLVVATAAVLAILIAVLIIAFLSGGPSGKAADKVSVAQKRRSIPLSELALPSEPLAIPGIQLFREPPEKWSAQNVKQWYTIPDEQALGTLRSAGRNQIETLLESVP